MTLNSALPVLPLFNPALRAADFYSGRRLFVNPVVTRYSEAISAGESSVEARSIHALDSECSRRYAAGLAGKTFHHSRMLFIVVPARIREKCGGVRGGEILLIRNYPGGRLLDIFQEYQCNIANTCPKASGLV